MTRLMALKYNPEASGRQTALVEGDGRALYAQQELPGGSLWVPGGPPACSSEPPNPSAGDSLS